MNDTNHCQFTGTAADIRKTQTRPGCSLFLRNFYFNTKDREKMHPIHKSCARRTMRTFHYYEKSQYPNCENEPYGGKNNEQTY